MREFNKIFSDLVIASDQTVYDRPGAVEDWVALTKAPTYTPYETSKSALIEFLRSEIWSELLASGRYRSIIELGPGSGENALEILKSLRCHPAPALFLVDISKQMLEHAFARLDGCTEEDLQNRSIFAIRGNFLSALKDIVEDLPKEGRIFSLLGGTLGNFQESDFFNVLETVFRAGDLLILGIEFHYLRNGDSQNGEVFLRQYSSPEHINFCVNVCTDRFGENPGYKASLRVTLDKMGSHSSIGNTLTVVTTLLGNEIPIIFSHRYDEVSFYEYLETHSFRLLQASNSRSSLFSKCMLFERIS